MRTPVSSTASWAVIQVMAFILIKLIKIDVNTIADEHDPINKEHVMAIGLDEVIAAETVLSEVDGNRGKLIIRGRSLDDLAARDL